MRYLEHGAALASLVGADAFVHGGSTGAERERAFALLRETKRGERGAVVVASAIGWLGLDVRVHVLVNCVGLRDPSLTIQICGRGLRTADDKESLQYHDFDVYDSPLLSKHAQQRINVLRSQGYPIAYQ